MVARSMNMTMRNFFCRGSAHVADFAGKHECLSRQGMIAVNDNLVIGDIGNGEHHVIFQRRTSLLTLRGALELHADFNEVGE